MVTVLWCYIRNNAFKKDGKDYHSSADLTGQANHLGVTIQADIIKQKLPTNNGGYNALNTGDSSYGKLDKRSTPKLASDATGGRPPHRPLPLPGHQLLHGPHPPHQLRRRVQGRLRPRRRPSHRRHQQARRRHGPHLRPQGLPAPHEAEGAALLHAIQDVYLDPKVTIA
jgi:class I fructose-bisphosphate aldolase